MTASIVHTNIFAHHATANLSLSRILNFLFFLWYRWKITKHIFFRPNHCLFSLGTFSTDTPPLFFEMEGVQEVSLALGHDEPVSVGCPLYNEASAVKGCLVLSSNVVAQKLD